MSTFAAVVFVTLLAPWTSAIAEAPRTMYAYSWPGSGANSYTYSTGLAACEASVAAAGWTNPVYNGDAGCSGKSGSNTLGAGTILKATKCSDGSAPDVSKPLEQQCGGPLPPQCPASGTEAGTHNFTIGWSYSGSVGGASVAPLSFPSGSVSVGGCIATVGAVRECYRSPQPTAQGLYRLSCDYDLTHTGQIGNPSPSTPDPNIPSPPPTCPGASGTVNGVPTCLESGSPTQPAFPSPPIIGNPIPGNPNAPGTSPSPSSYDPTTGAGSASPPGSSGAGGSGSTVPVVGGGSGGGTGNGENTGPKECGTPGRPKCQIDETGTPTGADTKITDEQVNTYVNDRKEAMGKKQETWDFTWKLQLPQGACQPWSVSFHNTSMSFDWCPYLEKLRSVIGWFYVMLTAIGIYQSFISTIKFNRG